MSQKRQGYLPLSEIIEKFDPAYPHTPDSRAERWSEWFNDPSVEVSRLVQELADELVVNGDFEEPVILCDAEIYYDEDTGESEDCPAIISDGMHRLAAHYRTGVDPVFVQYGHNRDNGEYAVSFEVVFEEVELDDEPFFDLLDALYERLSWRYRDDWLQAEGFFSTGTQISTGFYGIPYPKYSLEELSEEVASRVPELRIQKASWSVYRDASDGVVEEILEEKVF